MTSAPGVFLDRDGVLNRAVVVDGKPYPPRALHELEIDSIAVAGCRLLKQAGFKLICVTNQPDVARGLLDRRELDAINEFVVAALGLDDLLACEHVDEDRCECRKPKPGMIFSAAARHAIDLANSYMVGDRWRDIAAGQAAGCRTIFVDRHYAERPPTGMTFTCSNLGEATDYILGERFR